MRIRVEDPAACGDLLEFIEVRGVVARAISDRELEASSLRCQRSASAARAELVQLVHSWSGGRATRVAHVLG
jgi:hypothetical protein